MTLTKSDEYTQDWHERTAGGVWPTAILVMMIAGFAMGVNVFMYYRHRKR